MKFKKKYLLVLPATMLTIASLVVVKFLTDAEADYTVPLDGTVVPKFNQVALPFAQKLDAKTSLPFMASAVIDIDNDGREEVFLGGGPGQEDGLFRYQNNQFVNITQSVNWTKPDMADATFGATAIDTDYNGETDLIIARTNGVWLYTQSQGKFSAQKLDLKLADNTSPLQVAVSDINRDGHFDLYVAGYIKKQLVQGQNIFRKHYGGSSAMFLNNGDNTFSDITESSGLAYKHNTFMSIFVDMNNDLKEDLVIVHDTGHVATWKNLGNNQFKAMENPDSKVYSYPMGIAVTDHQNDGYVDFFFSNVGSTPPEFMVRGDLKKDQIFNPKWMFFKNKGDFKFDDIAQQVKVADYEFSWGAIFEDFNLDGRDDLVVSENYIGLPPEKLEFLRAPGRFLLQTPNGEFSPTGKESGVTNRQYGIAPLTADFNLDGYPDLIQVNLNGPTRAFINQGGDHNFLKVALPNTVKSIAAKIKVTLDNGRVLHRDFVSGEGLGSDQTHVQIFGLGNQNAANVTVTYIDGTQENQSGNFSNQWVRF